MSPTLSSRLLISDGDIFIFCAETAMANAVKERRSNSGVLFIVSIVVVCFTFNNTAKLQRIFIYENVCLVISLKMCIFAMDFKEREHYE